MNGNIRKLHRIASAKSRTVIGLMSGTSFDGLDIALCRIAASGTATRLQLKAFTTIPYTESQKQRILQVFAKPTVDLKSLCELNPWVADLHADMILSALKNWKVSPSSVDLIASHGQTVFHAPRASTPGVGQNSTLQLGDGDHLAVKTGITTISDFRQKHIAAGGEGAPLAVYGDYLLFSKKGENRLLLNMGGIANFTHLPGSAGRGDVLVTDTGPGNTLIDQTVRQATGAYFDRDALIAKAGKVQEPLLKCLKDHAFFSLPFPKTTGPELFNLAYVEKALRDSSTTKIALEDLVATLTRFSAETICDAVRKQTTHRRSFKMYISGGGAHNPLLVSWIRELLPGSQIENIEKLGIPGDAKEAVLFAVLGNEAMAGKAMRLGKGIPSVSMGKVSFPL
jgi:anhydro-N-acetylmuramic acid kinase